MTEKYMLDSSVWIRYFRYKDYELTPFIKELMEKDLIFINGIIQTELLKGAISDKNYRILRNCFNGLHFLEIDKYLFDSISEAAYLLRRKGITVPITDLIIAIQCVENNITLIGEDKHFKFIRDHFDLQLHLTPPPEQRATT